MNLNGSGNNMSEGLVEHIEQLISYYRQHSMSVWVHGAEDRLKSFVVEDFTKLLEKLEDEIHGTE